MKPRIRQCKGCRQDKEIYRSARCRTCYFAFQRAKFTPRSLVCRECRKEFSSRRPAKFCSQRCCDRYRWSRWKELGTLAECQWCKGKFDKRRPQARYCSPICSSRARCRRRSPGEQQPEKRLQCTCQNCAVEFEQPSRYYRGRAPKFCSQKCMYEGRRGNKSALYRGGINSRGASWTALARAIRARDTATCRACTAPEKNLPVDHAVPEKIMKRFGIDPHQVRNLFSLCRSCHGKKTMAEVYLMAGNLMRFIAELRAMHYPDAGIALVGEVFGIKSIMTEVIP